MYESTILYDPFSLDPGEFYINTVVPGFTAEPTLFLDIVPPLGAVEMRIIDDHASQNLGLTGYWQITDFTAMFTLQSMGTHSIGISFRNIDGDESAFITQTIIYDPWPLPFGQFEINSGDLTTTDREAKSILNYHLPPIK